MDDYVAHMRKDGAGWSKHRLDEHLREAGQRAGACDAVPAGAEWARLAGLWHDLGKYSAAFQSTIRRESGYDPQASIEAGPRNHSTAGAIHAVDRLGPAKGRILAYLIAGHHAGLPDWAGDQNAGAALSHRLNQRQHLTGLPLDDIPSDILAPDSPAIPRIPGNQGGAHLWLPTRNARRCAGGHRFRHRSISRGGLRRHPEGNGMTPRWLLNENFPQPSVRRLRILGWDVAAISEDSPSIDDDVVMERARSEGRWLATFDRDYGELVFKRGDAHSEKFGVSRRPAREGRARIETTSSERCP